MKERGLPVVVGRSPAAWERRRGGQGQEKRVWCGRFVGDGVGFKRYHTIWKISEEGLESSAAARSEHFGFERLPGEAGPGDSIFLFP